ncbi:SspB family protein [Wenxinia marina]|uniref:Stringent starvation protein B n=1 Tax=Wenxinia marina DSM 24838 TaxID=1123501 RepID=A0A0D0PDM1_9RHOB|nr:ClpXP protease specificity-enhancing factor SspB [Wenxinia marina]KIQ69551.1 hypothetical protein Wenmar_01915 [Wenxinia marina DSM 24838]GGL59270.1 hypothetical protein GCM10011392_12210 [Wenxinia marina]
MTRSIDYGNLMHRAMRGLIQEVLSDVSEHGLPGRHHFFITFDTMHPDVEIADWLSDRYPGEMTIVLQHWFQGLEVTDEGFSVTLNFGDNPEPLYIPYDAIRTFVDPSVEFGLRFETQDEETADEDGEAPAGEVIPARSARIPAETDENEDEDAPKRDADIVSLDSFRKG